MKTSTDPQRKGLPKTLIWVVVLVVLATSYFLYKKRTAEFSPTVKSRPDLQTELKKLSDRPDDPSVVGMALARLAGAGAPEGKVEAIDRIQDSNSIVRRVAAQALGQFPFDGETKNALIKAAKDSDPNVRMSALEAISFRSEVDRSEYLEAHLKTESLAIEEQALCHFGIYRTATAAETKQLHLDWLLANVSNSKNAVGLLIRAAPKNVAVIKALSDHFPTAMPQNRPTLYRYLVSERPESFRSNFSKLVKESDPQMRVTILTTIDQLCPPDRYAVLREVLVSEKSEQMTQSAALTGLERLGGKPAKKLIQNLDLKRASEFVKKRAESLIVSPHWGKEDQDHCDRPKKTNLPPPNVIRPMKPGLPPRQLPRMHPPGLRLPELPRSNTDKK